MSLDLMQNILNPRYPMYSGSNQHQQQEDSSPEEQTPQGKKGSLISSSTSIQQQSIDSKMNEIDPEKKLKVRRGSKACILCRKAKLKCRWSVAESASSSSNHLNQQCDRCFETGNACSFAVSLRGLRGNVKIEALAAKHHQELEQIRQLQHSSASNTTASSSSHSTSTSHSIPSVTYPSYPPPSSIPTPLPPPQTHTINRNYNPQAVSPISVARSSISNGENSSFNLLPNGTREFTSSPAQETTEVEDLTRTSNPLRLLADASASTQRIHSTGSSRALLSGGSFKIGPIKLPVRGPQIDINNAAAPLLLTENIITSDEATDLFQIFFDHCSTQVPFLDRIVHTPLSTAFKSPFLFTAICTVASRYSPRKELYSLCVQQALHLSGTNITNSHKSLSIIQGYLLLSHWHQPTPSIAEDRTYMFSGLAMRMCLELGLHCKMNLEGEGLNPEERERVEMEVRMAERTYIQAVITDRSLSLQLGKPYQCGKDYIIRNLSSWCSGSTLGDVTLCATLELQGILLYTLDLLYSDSKSLTGLNDYADYSSIMRGFLTQLESWKCQWIILLGNTQPNLSSDIYMKMFSFYHSYFRLFILSFAVQHSHDKPHLSTDLAYYVFLCFESASTIINIAKDYLLPSGLLKFGKDSTFIYICYAATFLLKLVNPSFSQLINPTECINLVRIASITLLNCSFDENHTPALYSLFLNGLIESKLRSQSQMFNNLNSDVVNAGSSNNINHENLNSTNGIHANDNNNLNNNVPIQSNNHDNNMVGVDAIDNMAFWDNMLMPGYNGSQFDTYGNASGNLFETYDFFHPASQL